MKSFTTVLAFALMATLTCAKSIPATHEEVLPEGPTEEDGDSNHQIIVTVITPVVTTFGGDDVISGDNAADAQAKGSVAVPKKDLPKQLRDLVDQAQDQKSNSDSDNNQIIVTVITPVITTFGGDDIITNQDTQETQETQKTQPKGSVVMPMKELSKDLRDLLEKAHPVSEENSESSNKQIIVTVITPVVTTFGGDDIVDPVNPVDPVQQD